MTLKYKILGIAILLSIAQLYAQNCVRLIRTKYDSSQNNELTSYFPNKINPWENHFNFAAIDNGTAFYDISLNPTAGWIIPGYTGGNISMKSPFSPSNTSEYSYLLEPVGGTPFQMDIHWEDGWELMWMNIGYYPNGAAINSVDTNRILFGSYSLSNPSTPYLILYNRYQGKLRVFANLFAGFNAYNSASLWLKQSSTNKSGIFRHLLSYDQPLDETTKSPEINSINFRNSNNSTLWWATDFQLGYDPCVCSHQSSIELEFRAVKTSNINLFGRSLGMQQNINAYDSSFLSNQSVLNAANSGQGGSLIFKSIDKMINSYDKELENYNTRMKSYNAPMNQGLRVILAAARDGIDKAGGTFVSKTVGDLALRTLVKIDGPAKQDTTTSKKWAEQASAAVKGQFGKGFDFITVAGLGKDFFEAPKRPSLPTATFTEMRIEGAITDSSVISVSSFLTPGSYKYGQSLTPYNYPAYNNAVGLFALLRRPSIMDFKTKGFSRTDSTLITGPRDTMPSFASDTLKQLWVDSTHYALRVKDALKYKLNRALDFDDSNTRIYVSFDVEFENLVTDTFGCYQLNLNTESSNFYLRDAFPPQDGKGYRLHYSTPWATIEGVGDSVFDLSFTNTFLANRTRIGVMVEHFNPAHGWHPVFDNWNDCISQPHTTFDVKKVTMKILADMYFDQHGYNGLQNNTMQSFTYLLYDYYNDVDIISVHETDETEILRRRQANLVLTNETIETTDPFVFETKDSVIYVNAERIELNGTIDVENGFKAVLQATKGIRAVSGTTSVSNKIRLKNVSSFSYFGKIVETTQAEVDAFCSDQNNGYKALVAANKKDEEETISEPVEPVKPETNVYPNPASNSFTIEIGIEAEKQYTFQVFDLMGRLVVNETLTGSSYPQFEIDTYQLTNGTYILRLTSSDGAVNENHRIVILK